MSRHWRDKAEQFSRDYPFAIPTPEMDPAVVNAWHTINEHARREEERELVAAEVVRQLRGDDAVQIEPGRARGGRKPVVRDADIEMLEQIFAGGRTGDAAKTHFKQGSRLRDKDLASAYRKGGDERKRVNELLNKRFERASKALSDRTTE